jgi:4-hydroxybenzoate polyprenyltransferase
VNLQTALCLGRMSNLPTVWSNVLAGLALAGWVSSSSVALRLAAATSLLYVGGMFLNDACDAEIDARERAERPIPAGDATRREVFIWSAVLLLGGVALAFSCGLASGIAGLATLTVIVLYDLVHKKTVFAPVLMAACRVGVYWTAALAVPQPKRAIVALGSAVLFAYVLGLTYAAAKENTTALVRYGPLLGLWAPALLTAPWLGGSGIGLLLLAGFVVWLVRAIRLVRSRQPMLIRRGIGALIAGIALVDGLWLALYAPTIVLAIAAVGAFGATLLMQRFVAGT